MEEPTRSALKILYVDDEELARKYFARSVEADYRVLTASSVEAALVLLASPQHQIGVIVTDYQMPGRVGSDLLRQVEQRYPHIIRILVTAYANKDVLLDTVNGGEVFRILEKPLHMGKLRTTLRLASARAHERMGRRDSLLAIDETLAFLTQELEAPLATIATVASGLQRASNDASAPLGETGQAGVLLGQQARYCQSVLAAFLDSVRHAAPVLRTGQDGHSAQELIAALLDAYPLTAAQRMLIRTDVRHDFQVTALPNCVGLVLSSILSMALRALDGQAAPVLCFTVDVGADATPQIRISHTAGAPGTPDPDADDARKGGGMFFCRRIMHSFGGHLQLDAQPGHGATVVLNFPAIKKE